MEVLLPIPQTPMASSVHQPGMKGTGKCFRVDLFEGVHTIFNSQRKAKCFHPNSYIETSLSFMYFYLLCLGQQAHSELYLKEQSLESDFLGSESWL